MFLTNFNLSEPIEQEIRLFVSSVVVYHCSILIASFERSIYLVPEYFAVWPFRNIYIRESSHTGWQHLAGKALISSSWLKILQFNQNCHFVNIAWQSEHWYWIKSWPNLVLAKAKLKTVLHILMSLNIAVRWTISEETWERSNLEQAIYRPSLEPNGNFQNSNPNHYHSFQFQHKFYLISRSGENLPNASLHFRFGFNPIFIFMAHLHQYFIIHRRFIFQICRVQLCPRTDQNFAARFLHIFVHLTLDEPGRLVQRRVELFVARVHVGTVGHQHVDARDVSPQRRLGPLLSNFFYHCWCQIVH